MIRLRATIVLSVAYLVMNAGAAFAQAVPNPSATPGQGPQGPGPAATPSATASPGAFTVRGTLRAYDFDRINRVQNASNLNRSAFNSGGMLLHADYRFANTPLSVGAAYYGAYPFGLNGTKPQSNPQIDNTLPGFPLSTFGETYLRWKDARLNATVGNQIINTPWALASDTRIKPALFQGIDATYALTPQLAIGATRMIRFENRTSSAFDRSTLITSSAAGNPAYTAHPTSGFLLGDLAYKNGAYLTALVDNYSFYDIANMTYVEARSVLDTTSAYKPTLAVQFVDENQTGKHYNGIIRNQTYGAQASATLNRNVQFSLGFDNMPTHYADVVATSALTATKGYFAPGGGTPNAFATGVPGHYRIAYGGIASPYTDAYATDPLFTTSISQGMVDRHSPGTSTKAALTFQSDNQRVRAILSEAYYEYGNSAGLNNTYETNVDVTYFVSPVPKIGRYRGLSFRERFADRTQPTTPFEFQYVRTQLQYDF